MAATGMTQGSPVVSVCIANYDGMGVIDACIASVRAQDCGFPVEIIVHDDASTDGSARHIRECHPDVTLIESAENVGFCVANNRMVAQATGEFVLLLNNDATLFPDALGILREAATELGRPAILGLPQYDAATGGLIDIGCLFDPFLNPVPNRDASRGEVGMVIGACLWIPKTLWQKLGGFPEWFGSIAEDMYLCCRARLAGYPVRALPRSGYRHWQGKSFGGNRVTNNRLSTTFRRRALSERNKTFVMVMAYPTPLLHLVLPFHLLLFGLEGLLLTLIKRNWRLFDEVYLSCFRGIYREWERLSTERKSIQLVRKISIGQFARVFQAMPHKIWLLCRYGIPEIR